MNTAKEYKMYDLGSDKERKYWRSSKEGGGGEGGQGRVRRRRGVFGEGEEEEEDSEGQRK